MFSEPVIHNVSLFFSSLKAQLAESTTKLAKVDAQKPGHERRTQYQHNKQLEELRNLQEQINRERQDWDKEREKGQYRLEHERGTLEETKTHIEKEQVRRGMLGALRRH